MALPTTLIAWFADGASKDPLGFPYWSVVLVISAWAGSVVGVLVCTLTRDAVEQRYLGLGASAACVGFLTSSPIGLIWTRMNGMLN